MAKLETGSDVLAAMMADAMACNRAARLRAPAQKQAARIDGRRAKTIRHRARVLELASGRWVSLTDLASDLGLSKPQACTIARAMWNEGLLRRMFEPVKARRGASREVLWKRKEGGAC